MELSTVVPWGRSLNEYREMFSLTERELQKKILGCGDGPACFNAELTNNGGDVISVDPIYEFNSAEIRSRVEEVYPQIMAQVSENKGDYVWKNIITVADLGKVRMDAMNIFLNDYEEGRKSGRYIAASLPTLPFENKAFDLALCSHYLFLYSEHISQDQHVLSMKELCRVASEIRVYPLLSISDNNKSPHLEPVIAALTDIGISISLVPVEYEFQKGATEMLVAKNVS